MKSELKQLSQIKDIAEFNSESIGKDFPFSEIEYIDTSSVTEGKLIGTQRIPLEKSPSRAKRLVKNNDIIISTVRPNLKHYYFIKNPNENWVVSTGFVVIRPTNVVPLYLYYFLTTPNFIEYLSRVADSHTSAYPSFPPEIIENTEINLPDENTQEKIGKILSDLDSKIENLQNQNKVLEQMAQAIFKSWFVDFDGVTEFEDSELGQIPKGWKAEKMPKLIEINPLRNLKKGKLAPYLGMADIPTYSSRILEFHPRKFTSGMKFMNGDTLVARITPSLENGKTAFVDFLNNDEVGWGSTEYIVLRPKFDIPPEYGYCFARTDEFRSHAIMNMTGTSGRQRVPENCFDDYVIVQPSKEKTALFGKISKKIFSKINENAEIRDNLIKVRDLLLPKLMSGQIRV